MATDTKTPKTPEFARHSAAHEDDLAAIEKVRDLLFGQQQRRIDSSVDDLAGNLRRLEASMTEQIEKLQADLALAQTRLAAQQMASVQAIGESVISMGQAIKQLAASK